MLEELLQWLGAGDAAILGMGPIIASVLAMLGGFGATQLMKFPIKRLIPATWSDYLVRTFAVIVTFAFAHGLGELPLALELVIAGLQPIAYTWSMAVIRRRWPWLEATRTVGSAQPSAGAVAALQARREPPHDDGTAADDTQ